MENKRVLDSIRVRPLKNGFQVIDPVNNVFMSVKILYEISDGWGMLDERVVRHAEVEIHRMREALMDDKNIYVYLEDEYDAIVIPLAEALPGDINLVYHLMIGYPTKKKEKTIHVIPLDGCSLKLLLPPKQYLDLW